MDGVSADDVWAVGTRSLEGQNPSPVTLHWDGAKWSTVASSNLEGDLIAVAAVASNDVWAVGQYYTGGGAGTQVLVLHWDGTSWTQVQTPTFPGGYNELDSVSYITSDDVWATGSYSSGEGPIHPISLHWDGTHWEVTTGITSHLRAIDALSATDAWGVGGIQTSGGSYNPGTATLVEHWDGTAWSRVPSPNKGLHTVLTSVSAVSPRSVWATGYTTDSRGDDNGTVVEYWDGANWTLVDDGVDPSQFHRLTSAGGTSPHLAWLTGSYTDAYLLQQWNGHVWRPVDGLRQYPEGALGDLKVLSDHDAWAVGSYYLCNGGHYCYRHRIILHWNGTTWHVYTNH